MLYVFEGFSSRRTQPQVKLFHIFIRPQVFGIAFHHDPAIFENVAKIGIPQRDHRVLLSQQKTHVLARVKILHDLKNLLDDLWREAH